MAPSTDRGGADPSARNSARDSALVFAPFCLDRETERLWEGARPVKLPPKAFALLRYLVERPQLLVARSELLRELWGDTCVGDAVLKTHINQIRRVLRDDVRAPRFIETVARRGYRFIAPVSTAPEAGDDAAAHPGPSRTIVVGRERELALLGEAFERCTWGHRELIFITGASGTGKTSLVDSFAAEVASRRSVFTAVGRGTAQRAPSASHAPVLEALGRLCRGPRARGPVAILRRMAPSWFAQVFGALEPCDGLERSGAADRDRMRRELLAVLPGLTSYAPVLLVLEDLHWADRATLELIDFVARSLDHARLMLIGTYDPQEIDSSHPLHAMHQALKRDEKCRDLELSFIKQHAVDEYLNARFGAHQLPPTVAAAIHQRTAGYPLAVVHLVDELLHQRVMATVAGVWRLVVEPQVISRVVPEGVAQQIERELARLDPREREIIEAASVVGLKFGIRALADATQIEPLRLEEACQRWANQRRFITLEQRAERTGSSASQRYRFLHPLCWQVILERVEPGRRTALKRCIAGSDERRDCESPRLLAALDVEAEGEPELCRAVADEKSAAARALRQRDYRRAVDHLQAALRLQDRLLQSVRNEDRPFGTCSTVCWTCGSARSEDVRLEPPSETSRALNRSQ